VILLNDVSHQVFHRQFCVPVSQEISTAEYLVLFIGLVKFVQRDTKACWKVHDTL
jgi:hypothetical protein